MEPNPKQLEEYWDKFSAAYVPCSEQYMAPMGLQLALQTKADQTNAVLEAGCGSGLCAFLVSQLLKPGTTYCCLDLSGHMLELFKSRSANCDFSRNPQNSIRFHGAVQGPVAVDTGTHTGVAIEAYQGDNEQLPFPDASFGSYFSSGSMHLVCSAVNMVRESYRVLKAGGLAGFSFLGKEKDSSYFNVASDLLRKYAEQRKVELPKKRSGFYLGNDEAAVVKMLHEVGYRKVKMWHQLGVYPWTAKELVAEKIIQLQGHLVNFSPELRAQFFSELESEVNARFVVGNEMLTRDFVLCVALK